MKRYGILTKRKKHFYNGYSWSRGDVYEATAPSGRNYEFMSGYSSRGDLLGYQLFVSDAEHDIMFFETFNELLKGINELEKTGKNNLLQIVSDSFTLYEDLQGFESGGVGPQRIPLGIVRDFKNGKVLLQWKYESEGGLSDCIYHANTEIHTDYYDISDGILVKTASDSNKTPIWSDETWSYESKAAISDFFKKYNLKNTI